MSGPRWLFEFEDLNWFPHTIRESMTDFLCHLLRITHFYAPVLPLIREGMQRSKTTQLVDLCSGGGGPAAEILSGLAKPNTNVHMTLTDKFPNTSAWKMLQRKHPHIGFIETSMDAAHLPSDLKGFRTVFSAVHHLDEKTITAILANAAESRSGIGIFDGGDKNLLPILGIILVHPLLFFFLTPFFRPFRFSRIFFTYLVPIIPLCTIWDGIISILRLYRPDELLAIAQNAGIDNYEWHAGQRKNKFGMQVTYLMGYPQTTNDATQGLS
ncbi:hypothetical protein [Flavobacterium sp.]|uniref:hypothetical protein n=1 Tax=Flavobacterium sp. TaxID=239 RepID=UPI0039E3C995